ncbi:helix-turn-helix domain-containing protein [Brevundimonas sp. VNH65]|uniref:helix-turn-helix domain-containing protein n=1 Tax=Brevundimonas sp. VNH65 TaxID=3400917 RepID=UPI003C02436A
MSPPLADPGPEAARDRAEAERLGAALAALRRDRGLSQAEAGARIGMTSQGWGLYESGRRAGLFRPDVQRRLTGALDATPETLAHALSLTPSLTPAEAAAPAPAADGVRSGGRDWRPVDPTPLPATETLQLSNDDLAPWAASGVTLEFDFERWPRNGQGCVIDLDDGTRWIRLYDRADADRLYLRGGSAGLDHQTTLDRRRVRRLAAVVARRE